MPKKEGKREREKRRIETKREKEVKRKKIERDTHTEMYIQRETEKERGRQIEGERGWNREEAIIHEATVVIFQHRVKYY